MVWGIKLAWQINKKILLFWILLNSALSIFPAIALQFNRLVIAELSSYISGNDVAYTAVLQAIVLLSTFLAFTSIVNRINSDFFYNLMLKTYLVGMQEKLIDAAQNIELANKMYLRGCELGDSGSMRYLALNYLEGKGLPKDYKRACSYLAKAVEHGNMSARIDLARMFFYGQGTQQDPEKAYDLLEPCLNEKYGRAYQVLGEAFEYGLGVEQNYPQAKKLYQQALELGYEDAQQALDRLDKYC